jgi:hypothetical protein
MSDPQSSVIVNIANNIKGISPQSERKGNIVDQVVYILLAAEKIRILVVYTPMIVLVSYSSGQPS